MRPTKSQTWGGVTIISAIAGTIASSFVLWIASGNLQLPKIVTILEAQGEALNQIVLDNKENAKASAENHMQIKDEISSLRGDITLLNHELHETEEDCDYHIANGVHK